MTTTATALKSARLALSAPAMIEVDRRRCATVSDLAVERPRDADARRKPLAVLDRSGTSHRVLAVRDRFKVVGVHARTVAAEMVELHPLGNRPDAELVGPAVSLGDPLAANPEHAIAVAIVCGAPEPTVLSEQNLAPEPGSDVLMANGLFPTERVTVPAPSRPMSPAPSARLRDSAAFCDRAFHSASVAGYRKSGEGVGEGTGVWVYADVVDGTATWKTLSADTEVTV